MKRTKGPRVLFYLDSNIILGQLEPGRRSIASKTFFEELERKRNWAIVVSSFGWAEVVDTLNESAFIVRQATSGHNAREVLRQAPLRETHHVEREKSRDRLKEFQRRWGNRIALVECEGEGWVSAFELVCATDIAAPDAIHVAAAMKAGCDAFLTEDEPLFKRLSKLHPHPLTFKPIHCADSNGTRQFLKLLDGLQDAKETDPATSTQASATARVAASGAGWEHLRTLGVIDIGKAIEAGLLSPLFGNLPHQGGAILRKPPSTRRPASPRSPKKARKRRAEEE